MDRPRIEAMIGGAFGLVALIALAALFGTALVVAFFPKSAATRGELALDVASIGAGIGVLALALGRHVARTVCRPVSSVEVALAAVNAGELGARVPVVDGAPPEMQSVAASLNRALDELQRLTIAEHEREQREAQRRERAELARASVGQVASVAEQLDAVASTAEQRQLCDALACGVFGVRVLVDDLTAARPLHERRARGTSPSDLSL